MGQQVLDNKDDILNFIYHSLHAQQQRKTASTLHQTSVENTSQHSKDLLIFEDHVEDSLKDSVDDSDTLEVDQILISTALSLLLATLEADSSINTENTPILTLIAGRLDIFVCDFPAISPVAHECQLVLSARNATSSLKDEETSSPYLAQRKVYAQALRDIQDSQLPVRAHGLDSLRKLVDQTVPKNRFDASEYNTLDPQLVKDILDVFIQAIKADDSYIYLNAVRGLVVMTDKIGHEILSQLSVRYAKHDQQIAEIDLDQRLRIGEAIIQVIRNLSDTLPAYTHLIIPQLIKVMSDNSMPTLLRASTLTILSQASTTCIRAIEPYMGEIVSGVEDILIIESLHESKDIDHPLDTQTNLVQLKRSALVLVAMVFRSAYETGNGGISASTKNNLVTKIRYIAQVDNDDLVRHQANEILDEFDWSNRLP
ncbi:hypothetical protein E3P99_01602 [Wallemia hederae]|uniref:RNA polymerase II assembly factor Rtp1 C-terminal domain-containing protein n=1 Tax=Wallemia hederae TaxID=1540922 RepID=A0A4T0FPD3_9BASI|nr:hypothetical protein E3P99_01602 [Wallemia hederae]